jgi:hypothetical protein
VQLTVDHCARGFRKGTRANDAHPLFAVLRESDVTRFLPHAKHQMLVASMSELCLTEGALGRLGRKGRRGLTWRWFAPITAAASQRAAAKQSLGQAKPSQAWAKPSQAKPSQAWAKPSQANLGQAKPSQAKPGPSLGQQTDWHCRASHLRPCGR